jgi:hypothetical protein
LSLPCRHPAAGEAEAHGFALLSLHDDTHSVEAIRIDHDFAFVEMPFAFSM